MSSCCGRLSIVHPPDSGMRAQRSLSPHMTKKPRRARAGRGQILPGEGGDIGCGFSRKSVRAAGGVLASHWPQWHARRP